MRTKTLLFFLLLLFTIPTYSNSSTTAKQSTIDSLETSLSKIDGDEKIKALIELVVHYSTEDMEKTSLYGETALLLLKNSKPDLKAKIQQNLIDSYLFVGDVDKAYAYAHETRKIAKELKDERLEINSLLDLCTIHYEFLKDDSLDYYVEKTSSMINPDKHPDYHTILSTIKASILFDRGKFDQSLQLFMECLNYYEKTDTRYKCGNILNNIALIYHEWGNFDLALKYYDEALKLEKEYKIGLQEAVVYNNIAEIYKDQQKYTIAIEHYQKTIDFGIEKKAKEYIVLGELGIAEVYLLKGSFNKAKSMLHQVIKSSQEIGTKEDECYAFYLLAKLYTYQEINPTKAKDYLKRCYAISSELKSIYLQTMILEVEVDLYEQEKNFEKAFYLSSLLQDLRNATFNKERAEIISKINAQLNLEEKEKELKELKIKNDEKTEILKELKIDNDEKAQILKEKQARLRELISSLAFAAILITFLLFFLVYRDKTRKDLKERNRIIQAKNKELEESVEFRQKLLSVISHDLKGSVGSISSMLEHMTQNPKMFHKEEIREQIHSELFLMSKNTFYLLDNLLQWAKSNTNSEPDKQHFELDRVLNENNRLFQFFAQEKSINLKVHCDTKQTLNADVNQITMVIRNLIANAIKFTPEKGQITVTAENTEQMFLIKVRDNGVGISEENLEKILDSKKYFTTYGTGNEKGTGLGLMLCFDFIKRHHGELLIESKEGEGSTFIICLPM